MNEIYKQYLPLIKSRSWRLCRKYSICDYEDAVQEASMALISVVEKFDPAKGKFGTLATIAIDRHLNKWASKQMRHANVFGFESWSVISENSEIFSDESFLFIDFMMSLDGDELWMVNICLQNGFKNKSQMVKYFVGQGKTKYFIDTIFNSIKKKIGA